MYDIITRTRDGLGLSREEIRFMINGYTEGRVPDYQMAAWCMAVLFPRAQFRSHRRTHYGHG